MTEMVREMFVVYVVYLMKDAALRARFLAMIAHSYGENAVMFSICIVC